MAEEEKSSLDKLEAALSKFWKKENPIGLIKGKNSQFYIEPKIFINNKLNPSVGKTIIKSYLKQITKEDIINKHVTISPKQIIIYSKNGTPLVELQGEIINKMANPLTNLLGKTLINDPSKEAYSFADIKEALIQFMSEKGLNKSQNPLLEVIKLI